jgi:hypothetical protein
MRFIIVLGSLLFVLSLQAQNLTISEEPNEALFSVKKDRLAFEEGLSFKEIQTDENSEEALYEKARYLANDPGFQAIVDAFIDKNANEHLRNYIRSQVYFMVSYFAIFMTGVIIHSLAPGFVLDRLPHGPTSEERFLKVFWFGLAPSALAFVQSMALLKLGQAQFSAQDLDPQCINELLHYQDKVSYVNFYKNMISNLQYWIPTIVIPSIISTHFFNVKKDMRIYNALDTPFDKAIDSYQIYKTIQFKAMICLELATLGIIHYCFLTQSSSNPELH